MHDLGGALINMVNLPNIVKRLLASGVTYTADTNELVYWSLIDVLFGLYCGIKYGGGYGSPTDVFFAIVLWEVFNVIFLRINSNG